MVYQANKMMFEKSKSVDDILAGKMILFVVDMMEIKIFSDNGESFSWAFMWIIVTICASTVLCTTIDSYTQRINYLTERGYEQITLPGAGGWAWQKAK